MGEDALHPTPQLRHHLCHTLTSLIEGLGMHIGLRGNTADIEAGASDMIPFEDRHLQALLGGIFSGAVAAWASADDNEIT